MYSEKTALTKQKNNTLKQKQTQAQTANIEGGIGTLEHR